MYRVKLSDTYTGVHFDFADFGEAMGFIGQAIESGRHITANAGLGEPIRAEIFVVDVEGVGLNE